MNNILDIRDLDVSYGDHQVLHEVNLRLQPGQCLGVVGESGSGKSTLARCILGLQQPTAGSITLDSCAGFDEQSATGMSRRFPVQVVFQDPRSSLNPRRRVIDIVAEPLTIAGSSDRRTRRDLAARHLSSVDLDPDEFGQRYPGTLSGGQAQRVAIARALAAEPRLLICDEAVSALDVSVQARVLNLLADIRERQGLSMVFITHDLAVVRVISDVVAVLDQGRIVEFADTEQVIQHPQHPYTQALIESVPSLPSTTQRKSTHP